MFLEITFHMCVGSIRTKLWTLRLQLYGNFINVFVVAFTRFFVLLISFYGNQARPFVPSSSVIAGTAQIDFVRRPLAIQFATILIQGCNATLKHSTNKWERLVNCAPHSDRFDLFRAHFFKLSRNVNFTRF